MFYIQLGVVTYRLPNVTKGQYIYVILESVGQKIYI